MTRAGHAARMGEARNAHKILVGKPERKRSFGRSKRRWKDNIRVDVEKNRVRRCGLNVYGSG